MDLIKIPWVAFSENSDNSEAYILNIPKKKLDVLNLMVHFQQ